MGVIALLLFCLLIGVVVVSIGALLVYVFFVVLDKIMGIIDVGCGCFSLIFIGVIVLAILGAIFS